MTESWKTKQFYFISDHQRKYYPKRHQCQFSWYCDGKADRIYDKKAYAKIYALAIRIISGRYNGLIEGATHYHADYVSHSWSKSHTYIGQIADTYFTDGIKMSEVEPMTPKRFSKIIEDIVKEKQVNYMDAILIYCENNDLEPEDVRKFISKTLKEKVAVNAQDLHYLLKQLRSYSVMILKYQFSETKRVLDDATALQR